MASKSLPENVDSTYADSVDDPSVALHQQYHDDIHDVVNIFDIDALNAAPAGDFMVKDGATGLWSHTAAPTGGGGGTGISEGLIGIIALDDETGTDDTRLSTALTAANAATYPPVVQLAARNHTFATGNRAPFTGMRISGVEGYSNPERNSGTKVGTRLSLSMTGGWIEQPAGATDYFSLTLSNLSFTGGSNASVITRNASATGTLYCFSASGIYSSGLRTVFGTQTTKMLITAASWTGDWEINNDYNGAFHLGGSDNVFWSDGMLLDSGTAFNTAGSANGQYHIWMDFMTKSHVGPLYITAEGTWNAIKQSGSTNPATAVSGNTGGPVSYYGMRVEGRNAGAPCNGNLFRMDGGIAILRDSWFGYAMASPTTPGHSPTDAGVIHQEGGFLTVDGCTYDRATGVATSVPFVYCNGGEAMVTKIHRSSAGGTWSTTRPTVDQAAGTVLVSDASVTVV